MKTKLIGGEPGTRRFALVLDDGDHVGDSLLAFAESERLTGHFNGIGALREATIAFWDPATKQYRNNTIQEQVEVVAFAGTIALDESTGGRKVHGHIVLGPRDGQAIGGHFVNAVVRPTLEVLFVESNVALRRVKDESTGLALLAW